MYIPFKSVGEFDCTTKIKELCMKMQLFQFLNSEFITLLGQFSELNITVQVNENLSETTPGPILHFVEVFRKKHRVR